MNRSEGGTTLLDSHVPAAVAESVDTGMVAIMRCLLALVALVVIYLDPGHTQWGELMYASLVVYAAYSAALCIGSLRGSLTLRAQPWVDVLFYIYLVALTQGTSSIFFHFFFFAIVAASFSRGFREGFALTMVAVLSFAVIGLAGYAAGTQFELALALTRTMSLYILGYMISYWGEHEIALRRRLSLLRELSGFANPRAGLDNVMAQNLTRLLEFFGAQSCLLVFAKAGASTRLLYRADRSRPFAAFPPDEVSNALAWPLLGLPPALRASFDARPGWLGRHALRLLAWEPGNGRRDRAVQGQCAELASLLEAPSFATVPYKQTDGIAGRLYLTSATRGFSEQETEFLAQVAAQMATAVNNVMLLDELTLNAAQQERSKISRDIHDTTVQSYIGLKLGLEALYRDINPAAPGASRIKELLDMATLTVDDLRGYVDRLRGSPAAAESQLLDQLEEQRRRYRDYHGIDVKLSSASTLQVNDRVAGEAYRVVCEALSNVFRHTSAKQAFVDLRCDANSLAIEVGNDSSPDLSTRPFMPRSIAERAMSLGGRVQVRLNNDGHDVVKVTIPLPVHSEPRRIGRAAI